MLRWRADYVGVWTRIAVFTIDQACIERHRMGDCVVAFIGSVQWCLFARFSPSGVTIVLFK